MIDLLLMKFFLKVIFHHLHCYNQVTNSEWKIAFHSPVKQSRGAVRNLIIRANTMHTWLPAFLFSCSYFNDTTKNHYNLASQIKTTEKQVLHTIRIIATPYCNFQTNTVYTRHRGIRKTYIVKFLFVLFSSAFLEKNCNEFAIMFWVHINLSKHNQLDRAPKYNKLFKSSQHCGW